MEGAKVFAQQGLVVSPPWMLRRSKRYDGRWYFFNTDTKASEWALDPVLVTAPDPPKPSAESVAREQSTPNERLDGSELDGTVRNGSRSNSSSSGSQGSGERRQRRAGGKNNRLSDVASTGAQRSSLPALPRGHLSSKEFDDDLLLEDFSAKVGTVDNRIMNDISAGGSMGGSSLGPRTSRSASDVGPSFEGRNIKSSSGPRKHRPSPLSTRPLGTPSERTDASSGGSSGNNRLEALQQPMSGGRNLATPPLADQTPPPGSFHRRTKSSLGSPGDEDEWAVGTHRVRPRSGSALGQSLKSPQSAPFPGTSSGAGPRALFPVPTMSRTASTPVGILNAAATAAAGSSVEEGVSAPLQHQQQHQQLSPHRIKKSSEDENMDRSSDSGMSKSSSTGNVAALGQSPTNSDDLLLQRRQGQLNSAAGSVPKGSSGMSAAQKHSQGGFGAPAHGHSGQTSGGANRDPRAGTVGMGGLHGWAPGHNGTPIDPRSERLRMSAAARASGSFSNSNNDGEENSNKTRSRSGSSSSSSGSGGLSPAFGSSQALRRAPPSLSPHSEDGAWSPADRPTPRRPSFSTTPVLGSLGAMPPRTSSTPQTSKNGGRSDGVSSSAGSSSGGGWGHESPTELQLRAQAPQESRDSLADGPIRRFGSDRSLSSSSSNSLGGIDNNINAAPASDSGYVVTSGLGMGGYSIVVLAEDVASGFQYAMKVTLKTRVPRSRDRRRLRNELKVMTDIPASPFLQRCHAAFETATRLFFVVDFNAGGDLFNHLVQRVKATSKGFAESQAQVLLAEVVLGLEHLHKHDFIHRDIKVENVMLDAAGHAKLIDFGLARDVPSLDEPLSPTGSLIYMAPELLRESRGGKHTDWWALGVLAHELLTGRTPWSSLTDKALIQREIGGMRVAPPAETSPAAGMFVCGLLHHDWRKRLGTSGSRDVKAASFFRGLDWNLAQRGCLPPALGRFDGAGPSGKDNYSPGLSSSNGGWGNASSRSSSSNKNGSAVHKEAGGARSLIGEGGDAAPFDVADCAAILGKYVAGAEGESSSNSGDDGPSGVVDHVYGHSNSSSSIGVYGGGSSSSGGANNHHNSHSSSSSGSGGGATSNGAHFTLGLRRVEVAPPVAPPSSSSGQYGWDDDDEDEFGYGYGHHDTAFDRRRAASLAKSNGFGGPSSHSPSWGSSSSSSGHNRRHAPSDPPNGGFGSGSLGTLPGGGPVGVDHGLDSGAFADSPRKLAPLSSPPHQQPRT